MIIDRNKVLEIIRARGIPTYGWDLPDRNFATMSENFTKRTWDAEVEDLFHNAPELVSKRSTGGGGSYFVPKWVEEVGDCDNASFWIISRMQKGHARAVVQKTMPPSGTAAGVISYTAIGRHENRGRNGRHRIIWIINHELEIKFFEPGDGEFTELNEIEISSATHGYAA